MDDADLRGFSFGECVSRRGAESAEKAQSFFSRGGVFLAEARRAQRRRRVFFSRGGVFLAEARRAQRGWTVRLF